MKRMASSVLIALCSLNFVACEDDTSQPNARDRAVDAACARFEQCGAIRPSGGSYVSNESCRIDQARIWEGQWPPGECDGRIDGTQLDLCINAIDAAECGEALDILNIVFNKCPKSKICAGPK